MDPVLPTPTYLPSTPHSVLMRFGSRDLLGCIPIDLVWIDREVLFHFLMHDDHAKNQLHPIIVAFDLTSFILNDLLTIDCFPDSI